MVVFPLLMLVLSENIIRCRTKKPTLVEPLSIIRNLVLPTFAIFIALTQILGLDSDSSPIRLLQSALLLITIHLCLSLVNVVFFVDAGAGTWQANVPKLLRDLVRFFLILIGTAIVLSLVWKLDLGNLITALGVSSIVIGLALQDTLGNLFSGITLLFGRPFKLGHWIEIGDTIGRVSEINWRSVHLTTREQELLIVPNSILAKEIFRNFNQPSRQHVEVIELGFSYNDPPNQVKSVLFETAMETPGVLKKPEPIIQTVNYNDSSIDYRVKLFLADYSKVPQVRDEFMTRVWYMAQRNKLDIPFPIRTVYHQPIIPSDEEVLAATLEKDIKRLPTFSQLTDQEISQLLEGAEAKRYGVEEPIIPIQESNFQLHLVLKGEVEVFYRAKSGKLTSLYMLREGEFFGTGAIVNSDLNTTGVKAIADTEVVAFDTETVNIMLSKSPQLSQILGNIIEVRRRSFEKMLAQK